MGEGAYASDGERREKSTVQKTGEGTFQRTELHETG